MARLFIALVLGFVLSQDCIAQTYCPHCGKLTRASHVAMIDDPTYAVALQKATYAARFGIKGHVLGWIGMGAATKEGCGFSPRSAQDSKDWCCFSGHKNGKGPAKRRIAVATVKGRDGWYSCALYVD